MDTNLELKDALSIFEEASNERKNNCINLLAPAALRNGNFGGRANGDPAGADGISDTSDGHPTGADGISHAPNGDSAGPDCLSDAPDGNAAGANRDARAEHKSE